MGRAGNAMVMAALAAPVLLGGGVAAVELTRATAFQAALQSAADGAALASARELALRSTTPQAVAAGVSGYAQEQLAGAFTDAQVAAEGQVLEDRSGVQVTISGALPSPLGALFGMPTLRAQATATARTSGGAPLCMLILNPFAAVSFDLKDRAELVVNRFTADERPHIVLNSDYHATPVPVPKGVGPRNATPFLTQ